MPAIGSQPHEPVSGITILSPRSHIVTITREEATSKGVLTLPELLEYDPGFFARRIKEALDKGQTPDLEAVWDPAAGTINSRFEDNIWLFDVSDVGIVTFGRLHKREKPNVNVALIDSERGLIGINIQMRKAAGGLFAQPVMGFNLNRLTGTNQVENNQAAAIREALEENGVTVVRSITSLGRVMVNQTSFSSDSTIFVIDADSTKVSDQLDFAEGIRSATWIGLEELFSRMNLGTHEGVRYDNGPLLWTTMKLLARFPLNWFIQRKKDADNNRAAAILAQQRGLTMAHTHWCFRRNHNLGSCPEGYCFYDPLENLVYETPPERDPESGLIKVGNYACFNCLYD